MPTHTHTYTHTFAIRVSNSLATASSGFNSRLPRAYSMIYWFLSSSRSRRHNPLPAGILSSPWIEKHLQLFQSCDSQKSIWVSSYIPAFFQPWLSSLNGPEICQHLSYSSTGRKFCGFSIANMWLFWTTYSSGDARICAAGPHGASHWCLYGVSATAAFQTFAAFKHRMMVISDWERLDPLSEIKKMQPF